MNEGRMYSHLLVGIFCRVQRKFIHFHLNLQLCETVVEWVLTCRGFCPEIATGCAWAGGRVEGISGAFRLDSFMHISCICHWQHQQQPHYLAFNKPLGSRSRCTSTATGAVPPTPLTPPSSPFSSVPAPLPIVNSSCCCFCFC